MTDVELHCYLEDEFRRYFNDLIEFESGHRDDALIIRFKLAGCLGSIEFVQTNADESDADWFIFVSDNTNRPLSVPFPEGL